MKVSIVIRTYNEQRYLPDLLEAINNQVFPNFGHETVIVDSGSTDKTLDIARQFECRIVHIRREEFSYGRSLNMGCDAASGEVLVFISGHCIPTHSQWLASLISPLGKEEIVYTYGAQAGNSCTKFSEQQHFAKYFPSRSKLPQEGFFCNNANAALLKTVWKENYFDENLTGLEDMHLSKRLLSQGLKIGYVAEAQVLHIHEESWSQVKRRFEREAIALQHVMPEVHISFRDFLRYFFNGVLLDVGIAPKKFGFGSRLKEIVLYRLMQFWGAYRGNHIHRVLSKKQKEEYFYPK